MVKEKSFANIAPTVISWKEDTNDVGKVEVAGTFSSWSPVPMTRSSSGMWTVSWDLSRGRHEYKVLVNGDWRIDDSVPSVPNAMGTSNNIIDVVDPVLINIDQEEAGDGVEISPSQVEAQVTTKSGKRSSFSKKSLVPKSGCHLEENPLLMSPITRGRLARVTAGGIKMSCGMNIGAKSQSVNPHSAHTQVMAAKLANVSRAQPHKGSMMNTGRFQSNKSAVVNNGRSQPPKGSLMNNGKTQPPKGSIANNGKPPPPKASLANNGKTQPPKGSFVNNGKTRPPTGAIVSNGALKSVKRTVGLASTSSMVGVLRPKNHVNKAQPIPRTNRPVTASGKTATDKLPVKKFGNENVCPAQKAELGMLGRF